MKSLVFTWSIARYHPGLISKFRLVTSFGISRDHCLPRLKKKLVKFNFAMPVTNIVNIIPLRIL